MTDELTRGMVRPTAGTVGQKRTVRPRTRELERFAARSLLVSSDSSNAIRIPFWDELTAPHSAGRRFPPGEYGEFPFVGARPRGPAEHHRISKRSLANRHPQALNVRHFGEDVPIFRVRPAVPPLRVLAQLRGSQTPSLCLVGVAADGRTDVPPTTRPRRRRSRATRATAGTVRTCHCVTGQPPLRDRQDGFVGPPPASTIGRSLSDRLTECRTQSRPAGRGAPALTRIRTPQLSPAR